MNSAFFRRALPSLAILICAISASSAFGQDGIYADFTTSMGNFTCKLEYGIAPKAAANFIGLATGQRAWLDLPTGSARTNAFYDGLLFHRVVAGFVIQAGSPNGQGTDGPGYLFPDQISPSLQFNNPGILAMANSGTNSNGSQFFITVASRPELNNGYTIFGELSAGTNVVIAISQVATNATSHPLTNVVIQNVSIRRVGSAAQAFDITAQNLPIITNMPPKIVTSSTQVAVTFSNSLYADNRLYSSPNLTGWTSVSLGIETALPLPDTLLSVKDAPARFYKVAQIRYPSSTFAPKNVLNRRVTLNFNAGLSGVITNNFDSSGGGAYFYRSGSTASQGSITGYDWTQQAYRADLSPIVYSAPPFMALRLNFTGVSGGIFNGTAYPDPPASPFAVSGAFTLN